MIESLESHLHRCARLGWRDRESELFRPFASEFPRWRPARIAIEHRSGYVAFCADGESSVTLAGRLRDLANGDPRARPVVGDWVVLQGPTIVGLLARRTEFVRKSAGVDVPQPIAANIDVVFLVTAAIDDFNPRRLERYLVAVRASGATPVIVLTKSDPHLDPASRLRELGPIAADTAAHAISSTTGEGLASLESYFAGANTVALTGSSGAGKSTLANRLLGEDHFATQSILATGRGQHTTTHRELCVRPRGGLLLDTPGMREFGLWADDRDVNAAFVDIDAIASACRFRDCTHEHEPGCAVCEAIDRGDLDEARWSSFHKLRDEALALQRRADPRLRAEHQRTLRVRSRAHRERDRLRGK